MISNSNLVRVYDFKWLWFNKIFLLKFIESSVYLWYLKNCTGFIGKPNNSCLCARCRIAITLVVFEREWDSLINFCVIFHFTCKLHFFKLFFPIWKHYFLVSFFCLLLLCSLKEHLIQCVVSNFIMKIVWNSSMCAVEKKFCI